MKQTLPSCFLSMCSALAGLIVVLILGMISWPLGTGPWGILIGSVAAIGVARLLSGQFGLPTSWIASGLGAAVACFLAISTAEVVSPGSAEWAHKGGVYGAAVGLPLVYPSRFFSGPFDWLDPSQRATELMKMRNAIFPISDPFALHRTDFTPRDLR